MLSLCPVAYPTGSAEKTGDIYDGWLRMYDLRFDDAHQIFAGWREAHPSDPLGPASDAAAYLFSELARLGALQSELFVDDVRFAHRKKLTPDEDLKKHFLEMIAKADQQADVLLQKSGADTDALFVKALVCGLRADYYVLVEKENLTALSYTKEGRPFSDKLLAIKPDAFDAYLGLEVENYLLSLKSAPVRVFLRLAGSRIDREKGLEQLRLTSERGHYFEPFAKLLLAVAALRDNNPGKAREILANLHQRFPNNELYTTELNRLQAPAERTVTPPTAGPKP